MYNQCWGPLWLVGVITFASTSQAQWRLFAFLTTCNYQLLKDLSFIINELRIRVDEFISIFHAPLFYNHALLSFRPPFQYYYFVMSPSLSKVALLKIRAMRAHKNMGRHYLLAYIILHFTCIWVTLGYHKWGWGIVSTQCLYCVLHTIERHQGTISEAEGLPNSMFVLCFTCIWATSGYHKWGWEIVSTQCLYCLLHAFEWHQGTISEAEGLSNSMFVLCFTHSWATPWYHKWGMGLPQLNAWIVFYTQLSDTRVP